MEQTRTKPKWHNVNISGRWRLTYKTINTMGPTAFGGKHVGLYRSPYDGTKVFLRNVDFKPLKGYMVDKLAIDFSPDTNEDHKLLINWMIACPEIKIEGVPDLDDIIKNSKEDTARLTLTCRDYVAIQEMEDEDYIDKLIGQLSLEFGKNAIGLDRLRYIMAELGLTYREPRFKDKAIEKKALRSRLKSWIRNSMENAKRANAVINDIDTAKDHFQFKEMVRLNILIPYNGIYKYNNVPLGQNYDEVFNFFNNHPEVKLAVLATLNEKLELE